MYDERGKIKKATINLKVIVRYFHGKDCAEISRNMLKNANEVNMLFWLYNTHLGQWNELPEFQNSKLRELLLPDMNE